jgi:hypothetical protein
MRWKIQSPFQQFKLFCMTLGIILGANVGPVWALILHKKIFRYNNNQENTVGRCGLDFYTEQELVAVSSEHGNNGTNWLSRNVDNQLPTNTANIPKEKKSQIHCGRILKSRMVTKVWALLNYFLIT